MALSRDKLFSAEDKKSADVIKQHIPQLLNLKNAQTTIQSIASKVLIDVIGDKLFRPFVMGSCTLITGMMLNLVRMDDKINNSELGLMMTIFLLIYGASVGLIQEIIPDPLVEPPNFRAVNTVNEHKAEFKEIAQYLNEKAELSDVDNSHTISQKCLQLKAKIKEQIAADMAGKQFLNFVKRKHIFYMFSPPVESVLNYLGATEELKNLHLNYERNLSCQPRACERGGIQ